jgi:hypothetical protein
MVLIFRWHRPLSDVVAMSLNWVLACSAFVGMDAFHVVRRSKLLWLKAPLDRHGLFRACEAEALRASTATAIAFCLVTIVAWMASSAVGLIPAYLLLGFHLSARACLLYLGLMHVRGWTALDVLCAGALVGGWLVASAAIQEGAVPPSLMLVLIAAGAGVTLALRLIALYRWHRIDWLVCKPPDPAARPTGLAG